MRINDSDMFILTELEEMSKLEICRARLDAALTKALETIRIVREELGARSLEPVEHMERDDENF